MEGYIMKKITALLTLALILSLNYVYSMKEDNDKNNKRKQNEQSNEQSNEKKSKHDFDLELWEECSKKNQDFKKIKMLIEHNANVNKTGEYKKTPLYLACKNNASLEVIQCLIEHKADVNKKFIFKSTILHLACEKNISTKIVKLLINHGADVTSKEQWKYTPLHVACKNNASIGVIKALLASFIAMPHEIQTLITYLCCMKVYATKLKQIIPKPLILGIINEIFVKKSFTMTNYINSKDEYSKTALKLAESRNYKNIVEFLRQVLDFLKEGQIIKLINLLHAND